MTEETDTIDVVFAVFCIFRRIVQFVVDAVSGYSLPVIDTQFPYGTRFRPEAIA